MFARHELGHALGLIHEHSRPELTIAYFLTSKFSYIPFMIGNFTRSADKAQAWHTYGNVFTNTPYQGITNLYPDSSIAEWDPLSIMQYSNLDVWTKYNGTSISNITYHSVKNVIPGSGYQLSDNDQWSKRSYTALNHWQ
jgi:hypothetical protein